MTGRAEPAGKTARTLSARELNRATLDRQLLLRRHRMDAADAVELVFGIQTQVPSNHFTALWTRLEGFDPEDFSTRFENREFVRMSLQRSTIHTVTARDAVGLRPLLQPVQDKGLQSAYGKELAGIDLDELAEAAREMAEESPRTFDELGKALQERYPDRAVHALGVAARNKVALVQVPPRGLWNQGGQARHTTVEQWLGDAAAAEPMPVDGMVWRYITAFGPVSVADVQTWSGLTRLKEVVERLRPRLAVFRDEDGVEMFDLPDAPRPGGDVEAPVRFMAEYDNVFFGYKKRERILDPDVPKAAIWTGNGARPVVLIDGFVRARWRLDTDRKRTSAVLTVTPLVRTTKAQLAEIEAEGAALLAFQAPGADHELRFETGEAGKGKTGKGKTDKGKTDKGKTDKGKTDESRAG
jgi:hypothetical protein